MTGASLPGTTGEAYLKCWGCSRLATTMDLSTVLRPCPSCGGQITVVMDLGRGRPRGYWRSKMFVRKGNRGRRYMAGWYR